MAFPFGVACRYRYEEFNQLGYVLTPQLRDVRTVGVYRFCWRLSADTTFVDVGRLTLTGPVPVTESARAHSSSLK